jgi:hypothetical protein
VSENYHAIHRFNLTFDGVHGLCEAFPAACCGSIFPRGSRGGVTSGANAIYQHSLQLSHQRQGAIFYLSQGYPRRFYAPRMGFSSVHRLSPGPLVEFSLLPSKRWMGASAHILTHTKFHSDYHTNFRQDQDAVSTNLDCFLIRFLSVCVTSARRTDVPSWPRNCDGVHLCFVRKV